MTPEAVPNTPPRRVTGDWLTADELAAELSVTTRTIRNNTAAGMPVIRARSQVFFDPAAVRGWLSGHQQEHQAVRRGRPANKRAA